MPIIRFKEEGDDDCNDVNLHDASFIIGGQWVGKAPPRPSPTHLLAPQTRVHEDGARDRDAPLVVHERSDGKTVGHGPAGADKAYLPE